MRKGFTIIELVIVIIITGILAIAQIPMIKGYIDKAIKTEAVAAMGLLRTAERAYYAEWRSYQLLAESNAQDTTIPRGLMYQSLGIDPKDLDGRYFSNECYSVLPDDPGKFIVCSPFKSTAPLNSRVISFDTIIMDINGVLINY